MARRPALRALAAHLGILPEYVDVRGRRRPTSDATRVALLGAWGYDAGGERAARATLAALRARAETETLLAPVRVAQRGGAARRLAVTLGGGQVADFQLSVVGEDGTEAVRLEGRLRAGPDGRARVRLPDLAAGYYTVRLEAGSREARQSLVVHPGACPPIASRLDARRAFGVWANLYSVRSAANWGAGDLSDLAALARWASDAGAAFVGINPLHALRNRGGDVSPYSPVSRLFRNPLYLDVAAVPELAEAPEAVAGGLAPTGDRVGYEEIMARKWPALETLHRVFAARHRGRGTPRGEAYAHYEAVQGEALADFATFVALDAHFGSDRRTWPAVFRDPGSHAVREFRAAHADTVDLHRYVQFELDRQLAAAQRAGAALTLGLYGDLAIGSAANGSDAWAFGGLFRDGLELGAPPDDYFAAGQAWGLPVVDPHRLAADGYRYWILVLRAALAHCGMLRLDHVMGLFRQYWIPSGGPPGGGAYVRQPAADLLGILALEAQRHGVVIVGEDLGTVPRGLRAELARRNMLSSRMLFFERDARGGFRPARRYPRHALVAVHTHDHIPLAGFWQGRDLAVARSLDIITSDARLASARTRRAAARRALVRRLGIGPAPSPPELCEAAYRFLAGTPAVLVGASLDDLTGEVEPINVPGVGPDRFASWTRRMAVPLEALASHDHVRRGLAGLAGRGGGRPLERGASID